MSLDLHRERGAAPTRTEQLEDQGDVAWLGVYARITNHEPTEKATLIPDFPLLLLPCVDLLLPEIERKQARHSPGSRSTQSGAQSY